MIEMFVIHLGSSGFPDGNAQIQRIRLTFKGLKLAGCIPLILNKHSIRKTGNTRRLTRYQGIPYIFLSAFVSRPDNFIWRNLNKFTGYFGELVLLIKKRKSIHTAIFYDSSFAQLLYYRILSKLLGFKLIIQYVEYRSSIRHGRNLLTHLNDLAFDNYCFFLCDGIIVISEFLRNRTISKNIFLPIIKIPAICDFDEFDTELKVKAENYLMYCGTIIYIEVIEFVLDLFIRLKKSEMYGGRLLFVVGGDAKDVDYKRLENKINNSHYKESILLQKNIPYQELIALYKKSELLIVPLRNTQQDIARFQHKIGEYTATRRPIISTNIGELKYYFKTGFSAILAEEYSIESYMNKLNGMLSSKATLAQIGEEGFKVGQEKLNYKTYAFELKQFITELNR
jgi:glycosyltransferase involved in cell wall biosynthesis